MIEFGKTLRAAREAKGLTTGQVAEQTHMMVQTVEGLENEDFSKIVAPIYGRGFVKLYCEAVGLDPKPLVDAFTEIYADRHVSSSKAPPTRPEPPERAPTPPDRQPEPVSEEPPPNRGEFDFGALKQAPAAPSLSRYAGNLPPDADSRPSPLAFVNWRIVALAAGAFVVLLGLALCIRAVYRATMSAPQPAVEEEPAVAAPAQQPAKNAPAPQPTPAESAVQPQAAERKPLPLKPFYIDSDHSSEKANSI